MPVPPTGTGLVLCQAASMSSPSAAVAASNRSGAPDADMTGLGLGLLHDRERDQASELSTNGAGIKSSYIWGSGAYTPILPLRCSTTPVPVW